MNSIRALMMIVFLFSIYSLLVFGIFPNLSFAPYSIRNNGRFGLSKLKSLLERNGFRVMTIISSLQALSKVNESAIIVIIGPAIEFSQYEVISLLSYLGMHGGALLIADDFGQANSLLDGIWTMLSYTIPGQKFQLVGLYFNRSAVLMDAESYYKTPAAPIITRFNDPYGILRGVNAILTNFPSVIVAKFKLENGSERFVPLPGEAGFLASTQYSWLETSLKDAKEGSATPDPNEWGGISFSLSIIGDFASVRFAMISDPDIFTNDVLDEASKIGCDNEKFILNLFEWLSQVCEEKLVIFDESHLSKTPFEPVFWLGLWLSGLLWLSTSWFLAPVIPIILISILLGFAGHAVSPKIPILKPERRELISEFRERLRFFIQKRDFVSALSMYIAYLIFEMKRKHGIAKEKILEIIEEFSHISSTFHERYRDRFLRLLNVLENARMQKIRITEEDFIKHMRLLGELEELIRTPR